MKLHYYSDTDSLYIDLFETAASDSREIGLGIVGDFDDKGNLVGLDIDRASKRVRLDHLEIDSLPVHKAA